MAPVSGAQIIARSLRDLGVTVIFGLVGIPVVEIAEEAINLGIRFVAFRNEQACSYAASVYGYMTGRPGVCLVVGGPGVLHAMAGVSRQQPKRLGYLSRSYGALAAINILTVRYTDRQCFCQQLPATRPCRFR